MSFIRSGKNAALAIFMVALATACGPMPEETTGQELQAATATSPLVRSEPSPSGSAFDMALRVNSKEQSAHFEVSPDAMRALGALHRMSAGGQTSAREVPVKSIVQERIQRAINEGKLPLPEGAAPSITVKAQAEIVPAPEGVSTLDVCVVPAIISLWYTYVYSYPSCTYYQVVDHYDGFYNQCDGSYYLVTYLGSEVYGPYSCG
jgi:hypothetical protein